MKWLLIVAGIFTLAILAVLILGLLQPAKHSVTRSIHLNQNPGTVFAALDNTADLPTWSSTVSKVEPMPDQDGKAVTRITMKWGNMQMRMTRLDRTPPTRLVISMAREEGPALGTWTYEIAPESGGCRVALTEEGELKNPMFRAIGRIRGLDANILETLRDLAKKFNESADIRAGR